MLLAVAVLLLQPLAVPQNLIAPVAILASSADADSRSAAIAEEPLLVPEFDVSGAAFNPARSAPEPASPSPLVTVIVMPVPADAPDSPGAADAAQPADPAATPAIERKSPVGGAFAVSDVAASEGRLAQQRRMWLALSMTQHGAAAFDAWSTRRAISSGAGRELNPMLRPFAGNASLYAAIQVGPLVLDYISRRMMTSRHGWERHTWWLPQTLGTAMSLASGAHNLGLHAAN